MISIAGKLIFEEPTNDDKANAVVEQIVNDAVYGTFFELPKKYFGKEKWRTPPEKLAKLVRSKIDQDSKTVCNFEFQLSETLFPISPCGLQHLVGILSGDTFRPSKPAVRAQVTQVELPVSMEQALIDRFRLNRSHDIKSIRTLFKLGDFQPLLAFSFKPRVGLKFQTIREATLEILRSGFHLVEVDTRDVRVDESSLSDLIQLSRQAADLHDSGEVKHVTRFAPNLSVPAHLIVDLAKRFRDAHTNDPFVIKIDGGLDGLSACQALRDGWKWKSNGPIVTCYPLLRSQLASHVPPAFFTKILALSGVDIIYPGNRPNFGRSVGEVSSKLADEEKKSPRGFEAASKEALISSMKWYSELSDPGWPMLSVAGGIFAPELHAFYEFLGPDVAFFVGGGVACHKDGPKQGAKLCADILAEAVKMRIKETPGPLTDKLRVRIETAYGEENEVGYIDPFERIKKTRGLKSWFESKGRNS
jgi:ribulose 1,5-bisphosphate carboxylase large subunit-like protein